MTDLRDIKIIIGDYSVVGRGFMRAEDAKPQGMDGEAFVEHATVVMVELHEGQKIIPYQEIGDEIEFDYIDIEPGMYRFDAKGPKRVGDLPDDTT